MSPQSLFGKSGINVFVQEDGGHGDEDHGLGEVEALLIVVVTSPREADLAQRGVRTARR